jgi:hypothetical protein
MMLLWLMDEEICANARDDMRIIGFVLVLNMQVLQYDS